MWQHSLLWSSRVFAIETGYRVSSSWISISSDRLENTQSLGQAYLYPRSPYFYHSQSEICHSKPCPFVLLFLLPPAHPGCQWLSKFVQPSLRVNKIYIWQTLSFFLQDMYAGQANQNELNSNLLKSQLAASVHSRSQSLSGLQPVNIIVYIYIYIRTVSS